MAPELRPEQDINDLYAVAVIESITYYDLCPTDLTRIFICTFHCMELSQYVHCIEIILITRCNSIIHRTTHYNYIGEKITQMSNDAQVHHIVSNILIATASGHLVSDNLTDAWEIHKAFQAYHSETKVGCLCLKEPPLITEAVNMTADEPYA